MDKNVVANIRRWECCSCLPNVVKISDTVGVGVCQNWPIVCPSYKIALTYIQTYSWYRLPLVGYYWAQMAEMLSKIMQVLCPVRHRPQSNVSVHPS
jgi:hypothetical protein